MKIDIVTIFPDMFASAFDRGIIAQSRRKSILEIELVDLRDYSDDSHRTVDDRPYGGGEGMVLKPEPIFRAVEAIDLRRKGRGRVILLSPQGRQFDQSVANEYSALEHLVLVCGRYEGVDQRVSDHLVDEELSVGDYVVSGGEFPAMIVVDAVTRLLHGAVGNSRSVLEDSFMYDQLDCPHYTRPACYRDMKVPAALLSGDHRRIAKWREEAGLERTRKRRPDLLNGTASRGRRSTVEEELT